MSPERLERIRRAVGVDASEVQALRGRVAHLEADLARVRAAAVKKGRVAAEYKDQAIGLERRLRDARMDIQEEYDQRIEDLTRKLCNAEVENEMLRAADGRWRSAEPSILGPRGVIRAS